jgi:hypothetical protein
MSPVRHAPAELTAGDTALRAQYMTEVLEVLYPHGQITAEPAGDDVVAEYLIVPDSRRPRLLVPAQDRRIAAAAVRRYAEPTSRTARLKRDAVVAALRSGASKVLLRDKVRVVGPAGGARETDSIDRYLTKVLGTELSLSVHIGPARANRKPVLQLISPAGQTIGFGKVGTGPLTRGLVRAETAALSALTRVGLVNLAAPRVLHAGQWRGHEVLVQSALPIWLPRSALSTGRLVAAMREIATCTGTHTGALAADPYWVSLRSRLDALAANDEPDAAANTLTDARDAARRRELFALAQAADELVAGAGDVELRFGAWHGDWAPWNMTSISAALLVWDWERFTTGVPVGFDALHYDLQRLLDRGAAPGPAVDTTMRRAARLLAPFDVHREAARVTALLYLVELATRYLEDKQAEAGARLGVLGNWLLPVLAAKVAAR